MNIEEVQGLCKQLPGVTEDIKWRSDLCFSVRERCFHFYQVVPAKHHGKQVIINNASIFARKTSFVCTTSLSVK